MTSCDDESLEFGDVSGLGGGPEFVVVDPPIRDDLALLFERDDGWARDIVATRPELHKE